MDDGKETIDLYAPENREILIRQSLLNRALNTSPTDSEDTVRWAAHHLAKRMTGLDSVDGRPFNAQEPMSAADYLRKMQTAWNARDLTTLYDEETKGYFAIDDKAPDALNQKYAYAREFGPRTKNARIGDWGARQIDRLGLGDGRLGDEMEWLSDEERKEAEAIHARLDALVMPGEFTGGKPYDPRKGFYRAERMYSPEEAATIKAQQRDIEKRFAAEQPRVKELKLLAKKRKTVAEYERTLQERNAWIAIAQAKKALPEESQRIIEKAEQRPDDFNGYVAEDFRNLQMKDPEQAARLAPILHLMQPSAAGNYLAGDAWRAAKRTANDTLVGAGDAVANAVERVFVCGEEYQKRREAEAVYRRAFAPKMKDWGWTGDAVVGFFGTLPYMGIAAVGGAGFTAIALSAANDFEQQVADQGGDVSSWDFWASKFAVGVGYAAIEQAQVIHPFRGVKIPWERASVYATMTTSVRSFLKAAAVQGWRLGGEVWEEGLQGALEQGFVAYGLGKDVAANMARGLVQEMHGAIGPFMPLMAIEAGATRAAYRRGGYSADDLLDAHQRLMGLKDKVASAQDAANFGEVYGAIARNWARGGKDAAERRKRLMGYGMSAQDALDADMALGRLFRAVEESGDAEAARKFFGGYRLRTAGEMLSEILEDGEVSEPDAETGEVTVTGRLRGTTTQFRLTLGKEDLGEANPLDKAQWGSIANALNRAGVKAADGGEWDEAKFGALADDEKKTLAEKASLTVGGFFDKPGARIELVTPEGNGASVPAAPFYLLSGKIKLNYGDLPVTVFHEAVHAIMFAGDQLLPKELLDALKEAYPAAQGGEFVNEEVLADKLRDYLTGKVEMFDEGEKTLLERFLDWITSWADTAGKATGAALAMENVRNASDALFNQILRGDFGGIEGLDSWQDVKAAREKKAQTEARAREEEQRKKAAEEADKETPTEPEPQGGNKFGGAIVAAEDEWVDENGNAVPLDASGNPQPKPGQAMMRRSEFERRKAEKGGANVDVRLSDDEQRAIAKNAQLNNGPATGANGEFRAVTPDGSMEVKGHFEVRERDDLITSDREGYNPKFQPRDRGNDSSKSQIDAIGANPDANRLAESPTTDAGAPLISADGQVISGNGRVLGLRAADKYNSLGVYEATVRAKAGQYGLSIPDGIKHPVLVRVLDSSYDEAALAKIGELSNRPQILARNEAETAEADGKAIREGKLAELFAPDASGDVLAASNADFVNAFLQMADDASLVDSAGRPTDAAARRIRRGMLAAILGEHPNARDIIRAATERGESLGVKSILDGIMTAAPALLKLAANGEATYDLSPDIADALKDYIGFKQSGFSDIEDFLGQGDLLRAERPSLTAAIMREFFARRNSAQRVADILNAYARTAMLQDNSGPALFDMGVTPREEIWKLAVEKADAEQPGRFAIEAAAPTAEELAEAQRQYDAVVARYTNPDGTHKPGWRMAPNGKPSNLTERQWVQVRTPNFKRWFGDWLTDWGAQLRNTATTYAEGRKILEAIVGKPLMSADGVEAALSGNSIDKIFSGKAVHKSASVSAHLAAAANIEQLFTSARELHTDRGNKAGVKAMHRLYAPFFHGGKTLVAKISVKEFHDGTTNRLYTVEALDVEEMSAGILVPKQTGEAGESNPSADINSILRELADSVKPENVSKVVDENGEPLVVYHGTRGRFWEFDERKIGKRHGALNGRGFYFTSSPYAAREYASNGMSGGRTIPAFLNIRHPDRHDIDALGADGVIGAEMYHDLFVVKHPNQIKGATDNAGTFSVRPDIRYSVEVRNPWPADFPNATVLTTRKALMAKHGDLFDKAKKGDTRAAAALVREIMSDPKYRAKLAAIKERHPNAAIACPVHAEEEGGRNKIPRALATYAAKTLGLSVDTDIVQSVRAHHTGKDAFYRLTHRALFEGAVQAGKEYVLVDDHITQGGTINELRNYIENNGGRVVDVFSLTASQGSTILKPSEKQLSELRKRYGNELDTLLRDGDIAASADAITASEAAYILKLSPDTFRDRVAEARRERLAEGAGLADGGRSRYSIEALGQTEFDFGDANPTGTPEENIERAKTEAQRVLDRIGGTELGNAINRDFKGEGQTTIIGRTVRTAGDLAAAAQIYRNPCFETFRYFFTRGGKVVWQASITARMPGQTPATVKGETFAELNRMIEALDPDGLWILHNHPSGDVTPSAQDVQMSGWFSQHHNQSSIVYSGHVIIDHDKYTFIPPDGSAPQERYRHFERNRASFHGSPTANPSLDNPLLGMPTGNPAQVRAVALEAIRGQAAAEEKGGALTLVASSRGMVRAIATFPTDNVHEMRKNMRDYAAAIGALNMFVVGDIDFADYPEDVRIALASMCGAGEITDFIYEDAFFRTSSAVRNGMGPRKETQPQVEAVRVAESSGPRFSVVSDAATISRLDKEVEDGDYYVTYRAVERVTMPDGTEALVPPMNGYDPETRQYIDPAHEGDWLKADIDEAGIIDDGTGDYAHYKISYRVQNQKTGKWKRQDTTVALNPYIHTSFNPFNDQFAAAYNRPNLVVVRMLVPKSAASGEKAHPRAKDAPGFAQWKAGVVASQLKALGKPERKVLLSNYAKIDKVLSYAEVADLFDEMADGVKDKISIPANVMPPALRSEMESRGYRIVSQERFSVTSLLAGGDASREIADAAEPTTQDIARTLEAAMRPNKRRYSVQAVTPAQAEAIRRLYPDRGDIYHDAWALPDGDIRKVKPYERGHSGIGAAFGFADGDFAGEAAALFAGLLRIHIAPNGETMLTIGAMPTEGVERIIRSIVSENEGYERPVSIDFAAPGGLGAFAEYAGGTSPDRVMNEIRRFYRDGTAPRGTGEQADGSIRYSLQAGADLSDADNAKEFIDWLERRPAAPMPERLTSESPESALSWFINNMVGRTFVFDLPGIGRRTFKPKAGHFSAFVCKKPGNGKKKGWIDAANSPADARRLILEGKVSASDIAGYVGSRAKSLPLLPEILTKWDAILREKDKPDFIQFLKKFESGTGTTNIVVMEMNDDGETMGPLTAHHRDFNKTYLQKIDLVAIAGDEIPGNRPDNSATGQVDAGDNAERNSQANGSIISQRAGDVKRPAQNVNSELTPRSIADVMPEGPSFSITADTPLGEASRADYFEAYVIQDRLHGIDRPEERYAAFAKSLGLDPEKTAERIARAEKRLAAKRGEMERSAAGDFGQSVADTARAIARDDFARMASRLFTGSAKWGTEIGGAAQEGWHKVLADLIARAPGYDLETMRLDTGGDLTKTLMEILPEVFAPSNEKGGGEKGEDGEQTGYAKPEDFVGPPTAKTWQKWNENAIERRARYNRVIAIVKLQLAERQRQIKAREEAKARRAEEARKKAEAERKDGDAAAEQAERDADKEAGIGEEDAVETMEALALPVEVVESLGVDLGNADEFASFMRAWVCDYLARKNPGKTYADVLDDPVALATYRRTMIAQLRDIASALLDPTEGHAANMAERMISDIRDNATADEVERRTSDIIGFIQRNAIRQKRKSLIRETLAMVEKMAIRGKKFDALERDMRRKVLGEHEAYARYIAKVITMSDGAIERETQRLLAIIEGRKEKYTEAEEELGVNLDYASDAEVHKAQEQLAALRQYGGLKNKMPSYIVAAKKQLEAWLGGEREKHERRWGAFQATCDEVAEAIEAAVRKGRGKYAPDEPGTMGRIYQDVVASVRQRLEDMMVGATTEERRDAIGRVMRLLSEGSQQREALRVEYRRQLEAALADAVKGTELDVKGLIAKLEEKIPEDLNDLLDSEVRDADGNLIHDRQRVRMTWGQAMQLYASLQQTATYGENIALHGRKGHADAIRAQAHPALLKLVNNLRRIYDARRGQLSETVREVTGLPIYNPDPMYMPVKMKTGAREGLDVKTYAWSPLARSLTPRVRNRRDFDLSADLMATLAGRTNEAVNAIAFGVRGIALRSMLARGKVVEAMAQSVGKYRTRKLIEQLTDTLTDGFSIDEQRGGLMGLVQKAGTATTYASLSFNLVSALKQMQSLSAWVPLLDGGYMELGRHILDFDMDAARELVNAPGFTARYGSSNFVEMLRNALSATEGSFISRCAKAGMTAIQIGDFVPGIVVGTGVYKARVAALMRLRPELTAQQAKEQAATETWALIEECQQTGRLEDTPHMLRRWGIMGKQVTKFATAPIQQVSHEMHLFKQAWEAHKMRNDETFKAARRKFVNTCISNHVILPAAFYTVATLFGMALGDEPPEEEELFGDLILQMLVGPWSRLFFAGEILTHLVAGGERLAGLKPNVYSDAAFPAAQAIDRLISKGFMTADDIVNADAATVRDDFIDMIGTINAPVKYAVKGARNWTGYDAKKRRREARKAKANH